MKKSAPVNNLPLRYYAEADFAYLVKINRIGHNWSPQECSFLIGRPQNYVARRENLIANSQFTVEDMVFLSMAFDMSVRTMVMNNPHEFRQGYFHTIIQQNGTAIIHEIWQQVNGSKQMRCRLYEYPQPPSVENEPRQLAALIRQLHSLIKGGFFQTPRHALAIFRHLRKKNKQFLKPASLKQALTHFTAAGQSPRLIIEKNKTEGYRYKQAAIKKQTSKK